MKTFDKKDVYSWSNAEEAEQYIDKEGYFTDYYSDNLDDWNKDILIGINENRKIDEVFNSVKYLRGLFLPTEKVKEVEEKKYRPFKNIDEFMNHLDFKCLMNNYIKVEDINTSEIYELMIVGAFVNGLVLPLYGALTMDQLFRKFKLKFNDQFLPFGVEE